MGPKRGLVSFNKRFLPPIPDSGCQWLKSSSSFQYFVFWQPTWFTHTHWYYTLMWTRHLKPYLEKPSVFGILFFSTSCHGKKGTALLYPRFLSELSLSWSYLAQRRAVFGLVWWSGVILLPGAQASGFRSWMVSDCPWLPNTGTSLTVVTPAWPLLLTPSLYFATSWMDLAEYFNWPPMWQMCVLA